MSAAATTELTALPRSPSLPTFFDNLDSFAETPEGVAKLRELILQLAVQGELVVLTDEDQELLRRNTTVGDYLTMQNGYAFKSQWFENRGVRLVHNANIGHGELDWADVAMISETRATEFTRFEMNEGDIVLALDRPLISTGLKVSRITKQDQPSLLLQRVARPVFTDDSVHPDYFYMWLQSPTFMGSIDPGKSNGVPHISTKEVQRIEFAPPTVASQVRIVTKVDGLMSLCDELESRGSERVRLRERANRSCLERLVSSHARRDLSIAWQRLSDHFEVLYDTPTPLSVPTSFVVLSGSAIVCEH